jgi:hypothetical protein
MKYRKIELTIICCYYALETVLSSLVFRLIVSYIHLAIILLKMRGMLLQFVNKLLSSA